VVTAMQLVGLNSFGTPTSGGESETSGLFVFGRREIIHTQRANPFLSRTWKIGGTFIYIDVVRVKNILDGNGMDPRLNLLGSIAMFCGFSRDICNQVYLAYNLSKSGFFIAITIRDF
jgi:hypothetical protein